MEQKSSKVVRAKCVQQHNGKGFSDFILAFLLEDNKGFIFETDSFSNGIYKALFLVEVGDTIVYDGDEIVEIKFAI